MNAKPNHRALLSATAAALLAMVTTLPAHAAVDCATPRGVDQQRACKAASEGAESLRRFSERTRNIYQIYVHDYQSVVTRTAAMNDAGNTKLAERN